MIMLHADFDRTVSPSCHFQDNHALLMAIVLACMTIGVCLGAGMAFVCHQQEFMNLPWLKHMVEVGNRTMAARVLSFINFFRVTVLLFFLYVFFLWWSKRRPD